MAKLEPRDATGQPGPQRLASGTRVAAVRLTPLTPSVTSRASENDISQMPTQQLDVEELRAMALRCASDVGADEPGVAPACEPAPPAVIDEPSRPRLELVFAEDADDFQQELDAVGAPRRHARTVLAVLLVVLLLAAIVALATYR
jgi:hypothetical protein